MKSISKENQLSNRDTGPELLRIVSMIMIILHHISCHGEIRYSSVCFNSVALSVIGMGGKIGVSIFIIITGYYSITVSAKPKKAVMLILETVFYSLATFLFSLIVGIRHFTVSNILSAVFPFFSSSGAWFIVTYIFLYLLIPIINGGLKKINKAQHSALIFLLIFLWLILPKLINPFVPFMCRSFEVTNIGWFIMLYSIGAYLKLYPIKLMNKKLASLIVLLVFSFTSIYSMIITETICFDESRLIGKMTNAFYDFASDCDLVGSASLILSFLAFVFFVQIKTKPSKILYLLSGSTLGVYLIHDSEWIKRYFWDTICQISKIAESKYFLAHTLLYSIAIFIICTAIDIVRKYCFEKPIFNSKLYEIIELRIKNIFLSGSNHF